jgi:hypothetical protein
MEVPTRTSDRCSGGGGKMVLKARSEGVPRAPAFLRSVRFIRGDPKGARRAAGQARHAGREQLLTRPCRRRDRPGVHRLVAERRTWALGPPVKDRGCEPPGRGARAGGRRRLSGWPYGRRSPRTGQHLEPPRPVLACWRRGREWAAPGPARRWRRWWAGGRAAALRCGGRWHQDLCTSPLGYRAAR